MGIACPKEKDKKKKLPKLTTIRTKADNLLTPIAIKLYPKCLLCNNQTQVAHHHVHKSKSTRLRYELANIINLCGRCHIRLHHNESYWASKIVEIKGVEWFKTLEKTGKEQVKADVHYYILNYNRLSEILKTAC